MTDETSEQIVELLRRIADQLEILPTIAADIDSIQREVSEMHIAMGGYMHEGEYQAPTADLLRSEIADKLDELKFALDSIDNTLMMKD